MWLKLTSLNYKINFFDNTIVYYRINHESMVHRETKYFNPLFMECMFTFRKEQIYPKIKKYDILYFQSEFVHWLRYYIITIVFNNKKNRITKKINELSYYFIINNYVQKVKSLF